MTSTDASETTSLPKMSEYREREKKRVRGDCFPKKIHRIKSSILAKDFPSKIELDIEQQSAPEETLADATSTDGDGTRDVCDEKSALSFWRIANFEDVETIYDLIDKHGHVVEELFSPPDLPDLIEKSAFALVQLNKLKEMVSFTSVFAYPNIPAVPSFDWYVWLRNMYLIDDMTPRNCVFIHYMIWRPDYYEDFLAPTLETLFMEFPFLKYIVIVKPPLIKIPEQMGDFFIPVLPMDMHKYKWDSASVQTFLLCLRHSMLERLKIRLAMVEDHDDLMPIIERQTNKLRELYGDFCMAEIIEYPGTEDRKTLVCEVMGYAVAFMNVNRAIDLEVLNTQFDLGVFHGLRKPTPEDKNAEILSDGQENVVYLPETVSSTIDVVNSGTLDLVLNWKPAVCESETEGTDKDSECSSEGDLSTSMVNLIRESMDYKIKPKFSAYILGSIGGGYQNSYSTEMGERSSVKTDLSLISLQYYNLPEYHGPPNAFCIELFAVHENFDERLCADFLEAAFELFPELDYCLLTIPSQCFAFPLLDLFVRVTPRPLKRFKQELYVCHRSSVMITFMRVRRMVKSDLAEIHRLLQGIRHREFIYADMANSCIYPDSAYGGYVLICNKSIVGAAVVCYEDGLEYLTEHYHVSDLIDFDLHKTDSHAVLKHLTLSPIYQTHARFFLRDIMRMGDFTALYRARYEESQSSHSTSSLITVLGQFVPVKPRRMVRYHVPSLGDNLPPSHLLNSDIPFALYHINSRICGLPKFTSNMHLVIVGCSRTAFSFLENLLYAPSAAYVTYTNITWVSPHGPGFDVPPHPARDLLFPYQGKYDTRYQSQISLHTFVNIVYGVMTGINRADKYVTINFDAIVRYDILVLLCGKQHLMPVPLIREPDLTRCSRGTRPRCSLFKYLINQKVEPTEEEKMVYPSNVFVINTVIDATNAMLMIQYMMRRRRERLEANEKIIIYGQDFMAFTCIQSLLKFGVPAEMIVLVESTPKNGSPESVFKDPNVDMAVTEILEELNIEHYRDFILYDWEMCSNNQIKTATFHGIHRRITLKVLAMFPFEEKLVADVTFKAVNEASLVYDGRLVINSRFQTNDPFIYSAGSFTKYQRKYHADDKNHEYFSSVEVGKLLAEIIRVKIDPTEEDRKNMDEDLIPEMNGPILIAAQLPGDWNYFSLRTPGKYLPLETECNTKEYGDALITGDCKMKNGYGYFRIHLDDFGVVKSITCFTKDEIDVENLTVLYGRHEKYLNNLLTRFNLGMITDFFAYFRQPWAYALYHDKFKNLLNANMQLLEKESITYDPEIIQLIDDTLRKNKYDKPSSERINNIIEAFDSSRIKEKMTRNVLQYIQSYDHAFPMYASPRILRVLLREANSSLLHKPFFRTIGGLYKEYKSSIKITDVNYN
ncbi:UNVERIFIED_CONTAM: hypothetical protein PYX00_000254 [Menopon gallinae]|uniref:Cilia- and flagella-associated protein 61 N-terminal domain-containing protein n=1 Tax=Menopon gallinae TaxID=328185 RepID=A0AAW2I9E7_9NEOP